LENNKQEELKKMLPWATEEAIEALTQDTSVSLDSPMLRLMVLLYRAKHKKPAKRGRPRKEKK